MTWQELNDALYALYDGGPLESDGEVEVVVDVGGQLISLVGVVFNDHVERVIIKTGD